MEHVYRGILKERCLQKVRLHSYPYKLLLYIYEYFHKTKKEMIKCQEELYQLHSQSHKSNSFSWAINPHHLLIFSPIWNIKFRLALNICASLFNRSAANTTKSKEKPRHSLNSQLFGLEARNWIPAFAGMTGAFASRFPPCSPSPWLMLFAFRCARRVHRGCRFSLLSFSTLAVVERIPRIIRGVFSISST
jgi:hypothetical protein